MTFGQAVEVLQSSVLGSTRKVARTGWNGKGMAIFIVHGASFFADGMEYETGAFICMRTAQGTFIPWLCSQADALATDWVEVS